jgi:hypothetical protein
MGNNQPKKNTKQTYYNSIKQKAFLHLKKLDKPKDEDRKLLLQFLVPSQAPGKKNYLIISF